MLEIDAGHTRQPSRMQYWRASWQDSLKTNMMRPAGQGHRFKITFRSRFSLAPMGSAEKKTKAHLSKSAAR